ncbi:MAG: RNA polymerase-associated protein RapA [Gammaproteobacteria bacterium]|jgi:ATP-dependent helicase HepA|nr:RNA polymerase-associated protein RapA [Gammaproteobacteria bacterium]
MSEPASAFAVGQRWLSETQPELGLGMVENVEHRRVTVLFPATGERRTYAADNTPLWRAQLAAGELLRDLEGRDLTVVDLLEHNGFVTYLVRDTAGNEEPLPETRIDPTLRLSRPQQRLRAGRLDTDNWFRLRVQALEQTARLATAPARGLIGARISPIPHQLHIAAEVADRHQPRVLLADEVGLGKTIEAGLILHRLLLAGRVRRVLVLVPEPLLHQWLVELLRRFNRRFALFDRERLRGRRQAADAGNPFESEQQILCSLELLRDDPGLAESAMQAGWDLLICDEAHHLEWTPASASPAYDLVAGLAAQTPAVLLLTATPEQLGRAGHFGRLRLLDPERFGDYQDFLNEEARYAPVAELVTRLLDPTPLNADEQQRLEELVGPQDGGGPDPDLEAGALATEAQSSSEEAENAVPPGRQALIDRLLDLHGTGRVLFRNTRAAISGFPERRLYPAALEPSATESIADIDPLDPQRSTLDDPDWAESDPRVDWLIEQLRALSPAKVLLIAAAAETVLDLRRFLLERAGIHAAVFHEGMPIVERDRAAAFFADPEEGAQLLLCSEIGSEGRNFQFAHHLILFDLPEDPELLEQRIGRLDRIGQTETVAIHVPYRTGTADEVLFRWYHEGLDAFSAHQPAAPAVYWEQQERLGELLLDPAPEADEIAALVAEAASRRAELDAQLTQGRDRLLELSSHRPAVGRALAEAIDAEDRDPAIETFLTGLWDAFGVEREPGPSGSIVVRPGAHMMQERFPELPDEGLTATFSRTHALAHEERQFLTREHPLSRAALELVTGSHLGTSALVLTQDPRFPSSAVLLEAVYVAECPAPPVLNAQRFLPPTARRMLIDEHGQERSTEIDADALGGKCLRNRRPLAKALLEAKRKVLDAMVTLAEQQAARETTELRDQAVALMRRELDGELVRLETLAQRNPAVRNEEIEALKAERDALTEALANSRLRLDALRVIAFA